MPRIYYKEEKIAGQSFSNRFINIESFDEIFTTYDTALHPHGLKIGYVDMDSDSYVFMVHPIQATEAVKKNIEIIGYQYQ